MKEAPTTYERYDLNGQHIDRNMSNNNTMDENTNINDETATRELLIDQSLRRFFGFDSFKPLQKETILSTMNGQNVLTIVGTGKGKTLMYMLPAVLSSKPTVVLCPIKSLVEEVQEKGCIERIVFDEAHTISTWGATFRPAYKAVCNSLAKITCPLLLLKIEKELHEIFGDFCVYRNLVFRENLFLEVVEHGENFMMI